MLNYLLDRLFDTSSCQQAEFQITITGDPDQSFLLQTVIQEIALTHKIHGNPHTSQGVTRIDLIVGDKILSLALTIVHNYRTDLTTINFTVLDPELSGVNSLKVAKVLTTIAKDIAIEVDAELPIIHVDGLEVFS